MCLPFQRKICIRIFKVSRKQQEEDKKKTGFASRVEDYTRRFIRFNSVLFNFWKLSCKRFGPNYQSINQSIFICPKNSIFTNKLYCISLMEQIWRVYYRIFSCDVIAAMLEGKKTPGK